MIVFDASSLVSAAIRRGSLPDLALRHAFRSDHVAISEPVMAELIDVLHRPRLARFIDPEQRADLLGLIDTLGVMIAPAVSITECRDPKDNMYLELALAALAGVIVSSDSDLLVLHPWRGVSVLRPAEYLDRPGPPA